MIWNAFRRSRVTRVLDHPVFGRLEFTPSLGWSNNRFTFYGFTPVTLLIDGSDSGPSREQEEAVRRLTEKEAALLPGLLAAVAEKRAETERSPGAPAVSTLSVPALASHGPARTGSLWTIWFEYPDEEHWSYGVQSDDDWLTFRAFAED